MSATISCSPSLKVDEYLANEAFGPRLAQATENCSPTSKLEVTLEKLYHRGAWEPGPKRLVHFGLGGASDDEINRPPVVVEISRAIGSVAVLDVMAFSVAHLNVDGRQLTVKMINRVLGMLCAEFAHVGANGEELVFPKSDLQRRLDLEDGVKAALKKLRIERDVAINTIKILRFAEFKTPEVLFLSIPEQKREALPTLSGLLAPAAASVIPVVVADISPHQDGMAGGFEIFVQRAFINNSDNVVRLVSALEDVLVECHYRAPLPEISPIKFEYPGALVENQERPPQPISYDHIRELEADLRARGALL